MTRSEEIKSLINMGTVEKLQNTFRGIYKYFMRYLDLKRIMKSYKERNVLEFHLTILDL